MSGVSDFAAAEADALPATARAASPRRVWRSWLSEPGALAALPLLVLMLVGFLGPLSLVVIFAFMPPQSFSLLQVPTLANFIEIVENSYYLSFFASLWLATLNVVLLLIVCYPAAFAMVRVFGKHGSVLALLLTAPLFVADNLRLMGWMLFLVKGGVLPGSITTVFGIEVDSLLYTTGATLFGLFYIMLPFMLFPIIMGISMVPDQMREAAFDLGASRLQVLREIDIPLAMPGILIGALMTFILSVGSISEARILGGNAVTMIAMDIQKEFGFAQNWPKGAALCVLVILIAGAVSIVALKRIDLDLVFGRK